VAVAAVKVRSTAVLVALAAFLPVAVVVLAGPVSTVVAVTYHDYLGNGAPEARTVLTVDSFKVAGGYFPGGAGFGRFGSAVAAENYSPEYVARGYPRSGDSGGRRRTAGSSPTPSGRRSSGRPASSGRWRSRWGWPGSTGPACGSGRRTDAGSSDGQA
jgi:hypothetical protein